MPFLRERSGRWSPVKIAAFAAALLPALWIAYQAATDDLGARPVTEAIHQAGDWTLRFLLMTLAITPAQRILHYPRIVLARRTLGVATAGYALLHLSLYVLDQHFDLFKVASEIVLRVYLLIGAVALAGLIALASTSTDGAISRLGSAPYISSSSPSSTSTSRSCWRDFSSGCSRIVRCSGATARSPRFSSCFLPSPQRR
jgi:sulfoxide reductase heme-binding subunit YedZ